MKKQMLFVVVCFIAIAGIRAQGTSVPALQHSNTFYYLADGSQPTVLEKTAATMQTKVKVAGFGGHSTSYVIEGTVAATGSIVHTSFASRMMYDG
jgi:hypothetical protein